MCELVVVPPHLVEKIQAILVNDLDTPVDLREELRSGIERPAKVEESDDTAPDVRPLTIDILALERLSRWANSEEASANLKSKEIDPHEYGMISLLAGTELYLPSNQIPPPPSTGINPYLPSYLSPLPPSFGQEYRSLARQLSTVLNILFSVIGSAFAVYVAATTGGGYSREGGILLGVLAGVVVGIADGVLVWIFQNRVKEGREEGRKMAIKMSKGSAGEGEKEARGLEDGDEVLELEATKDGEATDTPGPKKEIRLRRRAIPEKKAA